MKKIIVLCCLLISSNAVAWDPIYKGVKESPEVYKVFPLGHDYTDIREHASLYIEMITLPNGLECVVTEQDSHTGAISCNWEKFNK